MKTPIIGKSWGWAEQREELLTPKGRGFLVGAVWVALATLGSVVFAFLFYLGSHPLTDTLVSLVAVKLSSQEQTTVYLVISILAVLSFAALGPQENGLALGRFHQEIPLFLAVTVPILTVEVGYLLVARTSPLSGLSWHYYTLVPVLEELLFRSLILSTVRERLSTRFDPRLSGLFAVIVSSVAFSATHLLNGGTVPTPFLLFQLAYAFVLGLCFGFLRIRTGSVLPSLAVHCAVNGIGVVLF